VLNHSLDFVIVISHFVFSSVILCFLSHFVRRRGAGVRGAGHRRMQPSPVGRRRAEEEGASVGEAMGGGCRGRSPVVGRHGA
jgi:hypothetical protein